MIIGISGKRGSGKDLLGSFLEQRGFNRHSFAGILKEMVRKDFGLTKEHTDGKLKEQPTTFIMPPGLDDFKAGAVKYWTPRQIMIEYGQFYRQFDRLFWVKKVFEKIERTVFPLDCNRNHVITDVRFINEANYIKEHGGLLVRLNRHQSLNIYSGQINDPSETELDNYDKFDLVVPADSNITPQDLQNVADNLCKAQVTDYK